MTDSELHTYIFYLVLDSHERMTDGDREGH